MAWQREEMEAMIAEEEAGLSTIVVDILLR